MEKLKPYVHALVGGLASALAVAAPIVENGLTPAEWISVALAFLSGSGLTAYTVPKAPESNLPGPDAVQ